MNKFYFVYLDIINSIMSEEYKIGDFLPSEHGLTKKYQVSRDTIRKALRMLEEDGYILKIMGKGSQILSLPNEVNDSDASSLFSFAELDTINNKHHETQIISIEEETIPKDLVIKGDYPQGLATKITRVRCIDNRPEIIDVDYLVKDIVPTVKKEDIKKSLYYFLEEKLRLDLSYGNKEITIGRTNIYESQLLNVKENSCVAVTINNVYLSDTRLLQITLSKQREESFKMNQFTKRRKMRKSSYK